LTTVKGYTLIETITVLLVISILAAVAIPNFLGWLHQYRLQAAAVSMINHFRAARLLAIFKGVKHQIQPRKFEEGNYYQVVEDAGGQDRIVMSIGRVVLHKRFGEVRIQAILSPETYDTITFTPKGTSTSASILLENSVGAQIKIIISNGRVKSEYL
jgi:prepilin-type N-terminal cleavage/methylation domain-containing protein